MLVISRRSDEVIQVGDTIKITVVSIVGGKVRLGIEAPSDVPVHRQEIFELIAKEQKKRKERNNSDCEPNDR